VLLAPFMVIFFNLLVSVYPRYPAAGRKRFPILRKSKPEDFDIVSDPALELAELPIRCALLSRTLYWKTLTLQIAYIASMLTIGAAAVLLFLAWLLENRGA
jgi:hypothetical protein